MNQSAWDFLLGFLASLTATSAVWAAARFRMHAVRRRHLLALTNLLGRPASSADGLAIVFPVFGIHVGEDGVCRTCVKVDPNTGDKRWFRKAPPHVLDIHDLRGVVRLVVALRRIYGTDIAFVPDEDKRLVDWWHERSFIAIGGPLTNLVSRAALGSKCNGLVEIDDKTYTISLPTKDRRFTTEDSRRREYAVVASLPNPVNRANRVVLCAGLADIGTEAACIHMSRRFLEYSRELRGTSFVEVLEIVDGQVDTPSVVETVIADVRLDNAGTESGHGKGTGQEFRGQHT